MSKDEKPKTINDADLDITGGVYVQEVPSGVKAKRNGNGILFFDEGDAIKKPKTGWAVFEPNNER